MSGEHTVTYWARIKSETALPIRRGAWYIVREATENTTALDVHDQILVLPSGLLDIVDTQPERWTVVPRPPNSSVLPPRSWGEHYGVCPSCARRAPLFGAPVKLGCTKCGIVFRVAWDEGYLGRLPVHPGL